MNELRLLLDLSSSLSAPLVKRVIRQLRMMKEPSQLLSGEDSGLLNVWDEICVQRQGEESFFWGSYTSVIRQLIYEELQTQPDAIKSLFSYTSQSYESGGEDEHIIYDEEDAISNLLDRVLAHAENYSNKRIDHYLWSR